MKNNPTRTIDQWTGMHSADPPSRILPTMLKSLRNGYCDASGRVVKSKGVSIFATASSWGITQAMGRQTPRSLHLYSGRIGENPDSKMLAVVSSRLLRSRANDGYNPWDVILFPSEAVAPSLNRAAAGVFRDQWFYHQNGYDVPFRLQCETDDGSPVPLTAEVLGLRPPAYGLHYASATVGNAKRFPPDRYTCYAVTFVYGTRGESGPSAMLSMGYVTPTTANDEWVFDKIPLGPTGCTARRIYRSEIGQGRGFVSGDANVVDRIEKGPSVEMFLIAELADNTTVTWTDKFDNSSLDYGQRCPMPRPFPPIARYQIMHLDKLFWAKLKEHPWTVGMMYDTTRTDIAPTDYRVTIANAGNGTITFEKYVAAVWSTDFTIANYRSKTLRTILGEMLGTPTTLSAAVYTTNGIAAIPAAGLDLNRTYTFSEISQRSIYNSANVYWAFGIDDTATQGARWFPNRFMWSDPTFVEQVSWLNSDDLTRFGSKKITNLTLLDNTPVIDTDTDSWLIPGSFIPDNLGVPSFEIHRSQAGHGSVATRPDAQVTLPGMGTLKLANDGLRNFRGESSELAGVAIRDQFSRVLENPVSRDQVSMCYHAGEVFIATPTYEDA